MGDEREFSTWEEVCGHEPTAIHRLSLDVGEAVPRGLKEEADVLGRVRCRRGLGYAGRHVAQEE
jgi:hypothetical protein